MKMNDYEKDFYKILDIIKLQIPFDHDPNLFYCRLNVIRHLIKNYEMMYCGEDFKLCCDILWYNFWLKENCQ